MKQHLMYWPIMAQALIPIIVLLLNGKRKKADVDSGIADREKAAMDNEAWSKPVVLTSKNLANQFQFPIIFYVLCFILISIQHVTMATLSMAWLYVAFRSVHAYAHVSDNKMPLRLIAFFASTVVLIVLFAATGICVSKL